MENCEHQDFNVQVTVNRVAQDGGGVMKYSAEVAIQCKQCGIDFSFEGLPRAINLTEPTAGVFGLEASLPCHPLCEEDKKHERMRVVI